MNKTILRNIHLVNWYGFSNKTIPISENLTLISGENECGKSTILDAIKYAYTGDTQFNKANMKVKIENISDNVANDILVYRICIVKNKDKIWKCSTATRYNVIKANDELEVELKTEEIREDKYTIQFDFKCNDKYGEEHKYHAYAFCENNSSTPYFSLEEIS